jgi:mRNA interferase RelE/StbE
MTVEFDKSFERSIDRLKNTAILSKIEKIILQIEQAKNLREVRNIRKLSGYKNYYRIKAGEYRIGVEIIEHDTVRLIVVAHRKMIYSSFPKK